MNADDNNNKPPIIRSGTLISLDLRGLVAICVVIGGLAFAYNEYVLFKVTVTNDINRLMEDLLMFNERLAALEDARQSCVPFYKKEKNYPPEKTIAENIEI